MSLRRIFEELYATAAAGAAPERWGQAERQLGKGAAITVRCGDGRRQVTLSRPDRPVDLVELVTFERDGQIPEHAVGVCWFPTRQGLYRVTYTWEIPVPPPTLFDLPGGEGYRLPEPADLPDHL